MVKGQDGVFVDAKQLKSINKMFLEAPKDIKKEMRKAWGKDSRKAVKIIKAEGFSRSSPTSLGKGPGGEFGHIKPQVKATRIKVGGKQWMWAWYRIGVKGMGVNFGRIGKSFVVFFHEHGTRGGPGRGRSLPARAPMATGWAAARASINPVASADKAIAAGLEKAAKRS